MSSVKNLKINEAATKKHKKFSIAKTTVVFLLVATLIGTGIIGYNHVGKAMDENQIQTIMTYYGENSNESLILDYIEIADKLDALDLEKYSADSELYEKQAISLDIMAPEQINLLIEKFKDINSNISTKDLNKINDTMNTVLNLKKQEQLVNKYIYTVGYSVAYKNVTLATKKYAGEVFGVDDYENLKFKYSMSGSTAEPSLSMTNKVEDKFGKDESQTYHFNSFFRSEFETKINEGVTAMIKTDRSNDKDETDNDKYNRERNGFIKDALEQSAILEKEVEDNDLYNEKLAGKLK